MGLTLGGFLMFSVFVLLAATVVQGFRGKPAKQLFTWALASFVGAITLLAIYSPDTPKQPEMTREQWMQRRSDIVFALDQAGKMRRPDELYFMANTLLKQARIAWPDCLGHGCRELQKFLGAIKDGTADGSIKPAALSEIYDRKGDLERALASGDFKFGAPATKRLPAAKP